MCSLLLWLLTEVLFVSANADIGSKPFVVNQKNEVIIRSTKDFNAVLGGKDPVYAKQEGGIALDGGTRKFKGEGYSLEVSKKIGYIKGVDGYFYGPVLTLDGASNSVSSVSFFSFEEFKKLQKK